MAENNDSTPRDAGPEGQGQGRRRDDGKTAPTSRPPPISSKPSSGLQNSHGTPMNKGAHQRSDDRQSSMDAGAGPGHLKRPMPPSFDAKEPKRGRFQPQLENLNAHHKSSERAASVSIGPTNQVDFRSRDDSSAAAHHEAIVAHYDAIAAHRDAIATRKDAATTHQGSIDDGSVDAAGYSPTAYKFRLVNLPQWIPTIPLSSFIIYSGNTTGGIFSGHYFSSYPRAYDAYRSQVSQLPKNTPSGRPEAEAGLGKALIIPPQIGDMGSVFHVFLLVSRDHGDPRTDGNRPGRPLDEGILEYTRLALLDFRRQLYEVLTALPRDSIWWHHAEEQNWALDGHNMLFYSPRTNYGDNGVLWEKTQRVINEVFSDWHGRWFILGI